jgi:hypothetical protein
MANANYKPLFSSASEHWRTPEALYKALDAEFHFTFDPCPFREENEFLEFMKPWRGERVFCNPPYGPKIPDWIAKAYEAELAVFLLPSRTTVVLTASVDMQTLISMRPTLRSNRWCADELLQ